MLFGLTQSHAPQQGHEVKYEFHVNGIKYIANCQVISNLESDAKSKNILISFRLAPQNNNLSLDSFAHHFDLTSTEKTIVALLAAGENVNSIAQIRKTSREDGARPIADNSFKNWRQRTN